MSKHVEIIVDYVVVDDDYMYNDTRGMLVRCRDCRRRDESCGMGEHRWCMRMMTTTRPDDFCSYGERKDQ